MEDVGFIESGKLVRINKMIYVTYKGLLSVTIDETPMIAGEIPQTFDLKRRKWIDL